MASFAEKVRGPKPPAGTHELPPTPSLSTAQTDEIEADLVEAINLQNRNAVIHPTQAVDGETLPEGYSRSYGGFLLRNNPRIVPVDQHMVRREMEFLSRHVLLAFFVGGRPPQHAIPKWLELIQRQVGGFVSIGRNLGRGFFQLRTKDSGTVQKLLTSPPSNPAGAIVSCKIGFPTLILLTLEASKSRLGSHYDVCQMSSNV